MTATLTSLSPADPSDVLGEFAVADREAVGAAVSRARAAFPAWRDAGLEARAQVLLRFAEIAQDAKEEIAEQIAREMGKALWDARAEAGLLGPKVSVTLAEGMRFVERRDAAAGACATYHPRGVLAVLGPFNFPAHLPNGHIVPALATGNCVVFKPSEQTPAVGERLVELFHKAGLPEGVLEIVHGGAETGSSLARHPDVDAVLFTGSFPVGRELRKLTGDQPGKLLALEMGGNNAMIVLADADLDLAASEAALSICATTGQRCTCAGRLFVAREVFDSFSEKLLRVLRGVRIGPPLEPGVFMGPLASRAAFDRLMSYRALARETEGERVLLVEPELPAPYVGPGIMRFESVRQTHPYQRDEIFGPEAALYPVDDLDQAIAATNDSEYGLAASIMTRDRSRYERCLGRVRTGILNWNKATVGASGKLPFGGSGRSGNDWPAGSTSTLYCTFPQAHLESNAELDPDSLPPGMPRP